MQKKRLTATLRREHILRAALEVFSEKGFDGATVKRIAERADINEGLLYRHFKSKGDLYAAIIDMRAAHPPGSEDLSALISGEGEDKEFLQRFAALYLHVMRSNEKLVKLVTFGQLSNPDLANPALFKIPYDSTEESPVTILASYIKRRMNEGAFVKKNPRLVARIFIGAIHWYGLRRLIAKSHQWKVYDEEEVLETIASLFYDGLAVRDSTESRRVKKRNEP